MAIQCHDEKYYKEIFSPLGSKNFNHKVLLNITFGVPHVFVRVKYKKVASKKDGSYTELILPSGPTDCQMIDHE